MINKLISRILSILTAATLMLAWIGPAKASSLPAPAKAALDPSPPAQTVKLIFIHHSTGQNWLADDYGGLGQALSDNNYFVSDTNYGWGPDNIGDRTDIPNWTEWFSSAGTPIYMDALYNESGQNSSYTRTLADPGGENAIVMFKSCFPNSALEGSPTDPPSADGWLTVGHAKYVYNQILQYFGAHPEKLFIVITAPPLQDGTYAANARAFNEWLMNDWLAENSYTQTNVAVFDFYNVLTGPNNHHRYYNGTVEHVFTPGMNTLYYPSSGGDDHPNAAGSQKATNEFVTLLNIFYHSWSTIFADVSTSYWAAPYIVRLYNAGVTGGCSANPLSYCPEANVTRAQMAVFLEKGMHGSGFTPPAIPITFNDTNGHWAQYWIEALKTDGITSGCAVGFYCPDSPVTRAQMAVFLLKAEHGNSYSPPDVGAGTGFTDVPSDYWAAAWIKQLAAEGITGGCGTNLYCPDTPVTRAQMAVFLVKTFNLP
ncbi:MAG: S-layer homology domain-containing protein [Chloroflexi bacterium]|nr:S-layer homology domain-containing protein [Chloroflexota bacterium]